MRARILRSTDVRKKVVTASFAVKPFTILRPATNENDEITSSKNSKLQANIRLNLQTPPRTLHGQIGIPKEAVGVATLKHQ